jgi:Flp pilus assembly CpaF family ATPase
MHPELERFVAKRMGATTHEVDSSHVPMLSHPAVVIDVTLSSVLLDRFQHAVGGRQNILISGGTSSGKTTLLIPLCEAERP